MSHISHLELDVIHNENCYTGLQKLPNGVFDCCVSSPPYYGLRNYGLPEVTFPACSFKVFGFEKRFDEWTGHLGLEPSPEMFVAHMVLIYEQVRRTLKDNGTCWVNMGDSYNSGSSGGLGGSTIQGGQTNQSKSNRHGKKAVKNIKHKDLVGVPWMLAFALREAGWYLRQDVIWNKPNPMPESVTDRCTKAHEYIFLLSKQPKYYFDAEAIKQPAKNPEDDVRRKHAQVPENKSAPTTLKNGIRPVKSGNKQRVTAAERGCPEGTGKNQASLVPWEGMMANKRSVWTVTTKPFAEAHFATFPEDLIVDCIKASTSEHGNCDECGKPYERVFTKELVPGPKASYNSKPDERDAGADAQDQGSNRMKDGHKPGWINKTETTGWQKICMCGGGCVRPATVLDPFGGSATTAVVSKKLNRNYVLYELNPTYIKMGQKRLYKEIGMFL